MITREMELTQVAVNFAARFGFLSKEIFFDYLCINARAHKYLYWKSLSVNGYFIVSKSSSQIYYLSSKGRSLAQKDCVSAKSVFLIPHDLFVAKILLQLESTGLLIESWLESELSKSANAAYKILGVDRLDKIPDLIVDLKGKTGVMRCAFEIERTQKSSERYDQISLHYLNMKNINLIIFGCEYQSITNTVRRAFSEDIFIKKQKTPITFSNSDFAISGFEVNAELLHKKMPLRKMFLAALELNEAEWNTPEKRQISVWRKSGLSKDKNQKKQKEDQDLESVRPSPGPLASFRDHPLPTNTLREGGHEPGAGVGRGPEKIRDKELE